MHHQRTMSKECAIQIFQAALPTEIWLQILEQTSGLDAEHVWTTVRCVSLQFKRLVEQAFVSAYLQQFSISLSLPRRHPVSGALIWPGAIPNAQIVISSTRFAHINATPFSCRQWLRDGGN